MTSNSTTTTPRPSAAALPSDLRCIGLAEAASFVGATRRFLESRIAAGELPSVKLGRRRLVQVRDLLGWVASNRSGGI